MTCSEVGDGSRDPTGGDIGLLRGCGPKRSVSGRLAAVLQSNVGFFVSLVLLAYWTKSIPNYLKPCKDNMNS